METRFTWSKSKAQSNLRKHGVSFEQAVEVFSDPHHLVVEDIHDAAEQRYMAMGLTLNVMLIVVVFVDRSEPGVEVFRIISARKAVAYEESQYREQFE
jgi:uncharacterized DUF497 family protein